MGSKGRFWSTVLAVLVALPLVIALLGSNAGCAPQTEPIERAADSAMQNVIKPAVEKAATELSTRTGYLQGQGSLINPGYVIDGHGIFGTGVTYRFSIRTEGLSGNLSGHSQLDQGQATTDPRPPGERAPGTQPAD